MQSLLRTPRSLTLRPLRLLHSTFCTASGVRRQGFFLAESTTVPEPKGTLGSGPIAPSTHPAADLATSASIQTPIEPKRRGVASPVLKPVSSITARDVAFNAELNAFDASGAAASPTGTDGTPSASTAVPTPTPTGAPVGNGPWPTVHAPPATSFKKVVGDVVLEKQGNIITKKYPDGAEIRMVYKAYRSKVRSLAPSFAERNCKTVIQNDQGEQIVVVKYPFKGKEGEQEGNWKTKRKEFMKNPPANPWNTIPPQVPITDLIERNSPFMTKRLNLKSLKELSDATDTTKQLEEKEREGEGEGRGEELKVIKPEASSPTMHMREPGSEQQSNTQAPPQESSPLSGLDSSERKAQDPSPRQKFESARYQHFLKKRLQELQEAGGSGSGKGPIIQRYFPTRGYVKYKFGDNVRFIKLE